MNDNPPDRRFGIVVPAYNHAVRLAEVVERLLPLSLPLVVVDDGSTDGTADILARFPAATVLRHRHNRGKGAALLTGMSALRGVAGYAVTLDADGQHDPAEIPRLMAVAGGGGRPLVIGRREGMLDNDQIPWGSRWGRRLSNLCVRAAGGPRLSDSQSGFRAYPLPETLELGARGRRYQFEVEVLVLARRRGMPVVETPVSVRYGGPGERISHFRTCADLLRDGAVLGRLTFSRFRRGG